MRTKIKEQLEDLKLENLGVSFIVQLIPNDGKIYENIAEAVITFNNEEFNVHIFEGLFKKKYINSLKFKYEDIKDVHFGKYGFKHPYVKIDFDIDVFFVFSYYLKVKGFSLQKENINKFFEILGEVEIEI